MEANLSRIYDLRDRQGYERRTQVGCPARRVLAADLISQLHQEETMIEGLSVDDHTRAARLLGDVHEFLVLADLKAELARSAPADAKSLQAVADEMNTTLSRITKGQELIVRIVSQLGEDGLRSRLFEQMETADNAALARVEALARSEGSLVAMFERRAALLPDLATSLPVRAAAPLSTDDAACVVALTTFGLSTALGAFATAAAALGVAQAC